MTSGEWIKRSRKHLFVKLLKKDALKAAAPFSLESGDKIG